MATNKKNSKTTIKSSKEKLKQKAESKPKTTKKEKTKKITTKGKSTAKKVAKKTLKDNLKQECQVTLTVDGSTDYVAGGIIELDESWGEFEGKYIIDKVTHTVNGDYTCEMEMMKIGAREKATEKAKQ